MTTEQIDILVAQAAVFLAQADLAVAERNLREARKAQWGSLPMAELFDLCAKHGPVEVLSRDDWENGLFQYAATAEACQTKVNIGGYFDNDRFRGDEHVYLRKEVLLKHPPAPESQPLSSTVQEIGSSSPA